jgi:hypothetical protein
MRKATIIDIQMELWIRERERGEILWHTKNGDTIPINNMSDYHLKNVLKNQEGIERSTLDMMLDFDEW